MIGKFATAAFVGLSLVTTTFAIADSPDPQYASAQCYKGKRDVKECCEEVLDGDKKEIAQCVKLVAEKRKAIADKKASKQP
jgi:hypothetical protein